MGRLSRLRSGTFLSQLPTLGFMLMLMIYPMLYVIWLSLQKLYIYESWEPTFIGFANYFRLIFEDPLTVTTLWNSVIWVVGSNIGHFTLGLAFAYLMNQSFKGRGFFRGLMFIPWVTPVVVVGITWRWMFHPDWGIYNGILRAVGLLGERGLIDWLNNPNLTWFSVIYVNWWKSYPFMYVNFLAALQSVPLDIFEASKIDGAGPLQRFRYIIWPLLKPVSVLMLLLGTVWTFINFEMIWLLTWGGPGYFTTTYAPYVYLTAFSYWRMGYGAAVGMVGLIICLVFTVLYVLLIIRRRGGFL